jgi:hypothetical protein
MENQTEGARNLGFVLSEAEAGRSRDIVTIVSGAGALAPGTVLGEITASGKFTTSSTGASDGSESASAVLAYAVDATSADVEAVAIVRAAQVIADELTYDASVDTAAKKAAKADQLETVGVIVR